MALNKHMYNTGNISKAFGEYLGLQGKKLDNLYIAGKLHDIGKIFISKDILNKRGELTKKELCEIKKHPEYSKEILLKEKYNSDIVRGVAEHHERIDGRGYPKGIKGKDISTIGKILAICDSYEAMTGKRHYRKAKSMEEALEEINNNLGTQFDKKLGKQFISFCKSS